MGPIRLPRKRQSPTPKVYYITLNRTDLHCSHCVCVYRTVLSRASAALSLLLSVVVSVTILLWSSMSKRRSGENNFGGKLKDIRFGRICATCEKVFWGPYNTGPHVELRYDDEPCCARCLFTLYGDGTPAVARLIMRRAALEIILMSPPGQPTLLHDHQYMVVAASEDPREMGVRMSVLQYIISFL